MLAPRWSFDPLSGAGAAVAGGRWNPAGTPALYLSRDHATAIAEYQQDLPRPGTLTAFDVSGLGILDLTNAAVRDEVGVGPDFFRLPWKQVRDIERRRPESWDFADAAISAALAGLLVPSAQVAGVNLVLWSWNDGLGPEVRHIDPNHDLPRDQSSWVTSAKDRPRAMPGSRPSTRRPRSAATSGSAGCW